MSVNSFVQNDFPGYLLDMNEFEAVEPIEQISYTKICKFQHMKLKKDFYVRFPPESDDIPASQRKFLDEVWIQIRLRHPSIQLFKGFTLPRDGVPYPAALFFNYEGSMTLQDVIDLEIQDKSPPEWTPTKKSIVIFGITAALKYIHSLHIIHNNLKTTKILLTKDFEPRLCDFSDASVVQSCVEGCLTRESGTTIWRSPEKSSGRPYTLPSDVFAYGQIIHSIVTKKLPFSSSMSTHEVKEQLLEWNDDLILEASKDFPPECEQGYLAIYQTAVLPNPEDRPTIEQFYKALLDDDIVYPGTDMKVYREYCNKLKKYDH